MVTSGDLIRRVGSASAGAVLVFLTVVRPVDAHEKWFAPVVPVRWSEVASWRTAGAVVVALAAVAAAAVLDRAWRRWPHKPHLAPAMRPTEGQLERIYGWIPLLLGFHAAALLIVSGVQLELFAPNLTLPRSFLGDVMALAEIVIGLSFVYGGLVRYSAVTLVLLWLSGMLLFPPLFVLEHLYVVGIAALLFVLGRGPLSVDALLGQLAQPVVPLVGVGVPLLRVLTGVSLVVLALTEKLWNVSQGLVFLRTHPLNFMQAVGLTWFTDERFIIAAGLVELAMGAVLISPYLTRAAVIVAWFPFNLSLPLLGWAEFVGHLPVYGVMLVLLVWGPRPDLRPYLRAVRRTVPDTISASARCARDSCDLL